MPPLSSTHARPRVAIIPVSSIPLIGSILWWCSRFTSRRLRLTSPLVPLSLRSHGSVGGLAAFGHQVDRGGVGLVALAGEGGDVLQQRMLGAICRLVVVAVAR